MRDYRSSMNLHILPKFGNRPIKEITYLEIEYRPMMQTRHTFATITLSEGENIGWVQHMLGHSSLQMIFTKYYAWMPKETRNDGSAMMRAYESVRGRNDFVVGREEVIEKKEPKSSPHQ
jgi:hypothetical protein